jgi:hypothetical protein
MKHLLIILASLALAVLTCLMVFFELPHFSWAWAVLGCVVTAFFAVIVARPARYVFFGLVLACFLLVSAVVVNRAFMSHDMTPGHLTRVDIFPVSLVPDPQRIAQISDETALRELESYFADARIHTVVKSPPDYDVELWSDGSGTRFRVSGDGLRRNLPATEIQDYYAPMKPGLGALLARLIEEYPTTQPATAPAPIDEQATQSTEPADAVQVTSLTGIVKSVMRIGEFSGKAIQVGLEPRYVVTLELTEDSKPPRFSRGEPVSFAIDHPWRTFPLTEKHLPGKQFSLLYLRGNEGEGDRLVVQVVTGPSPEALPKITVKSGPAATADTAARIKRLIADLAQIDSPDYGLSPSMSGQAFLPIPGRNIEGAGGMLLTDHGLRSSDSLRELVKLGPVAMPFLLDALDDTTPTKLTVSRSPLGGMWFANELRGNPANAREQAILLRDRWLDDGVSENSIDSYTVTVGDVCFVAIGQIVGRVYQAVRYQPSGCVVVNSPTQDADLCRQVRAIWSSDNPRQKLFDSLLFDYFTRGVFNGYALDGWSVGSKLQVEAALRLLYYFPTESAPLIADRLRSLEVYRTGPPSSQPASPEELDAFMKREVANGVRAAAFIEAVKWSDAPEIRAALAEIKARSDDPDIQMLLSDL